MIQPGNILRALEDITLVENWSSGSVVDAAEVARLAARTGDLFVVVRADHRELVLLGADGEIWTVLAIYTSDRPPGHKDSKFWVVGQNPEDTLDILWELCFPDQERE